MRSPPTSKQRVEALLAQADVRATALSAGVVTTLEAGSMVVDAYFYNSLPRAELVDALAVAHVRRALAWWSTSALVSSRRVRR
jgi:Fe2+ or Zn2+ uptake regulation protein